MMFGGHGGAGAGRGMPHPFNMMFMPPQGGQAQGADMGFMPMQMMFGPDLGNADPMFVEQLFNAMPGSQPTPQQEASRTTGSPPTSAAALRTLPKVKVTSHDIEANESNECSICLDDLVIGQPALRIPCGHLFHEDCVKDWLRKSNECPVCRYELPTDDAEYERGRLTRMAGRKLRMRYSALAVKTAQELTRLAKHLGIDVSGCLEKSELVEKIAASAQVQIIPEDGVSSGASPSSSSTTPAAGSLALSPAQLESMGVTELKGLMTQLGIETDGCSDKAHMLQRLVLSGRIEVTGGREALAAAMANARGNAGFGGNSPCTGSSPFQQASSDFLSTTAAPSACRQPAASESVDDPMTGTDPQGTGRNNFGNSAGAAGGMPLSKKSVGELRRLAARLGVSLDGCLEKAELVQRIQESPSFQAS